MSIPERVSTYDLLEQQKNTALALKEKFPPGRGTTSPIKFVSWKSGTDRGDVKSGAIQSVTDQETALLGHQIEVACRNLTPVDLTQPDGTTVKVPAIALLLITQRISMWKQELNEYQRQLDAAREEVTRKNNSIRDDCTQKPGSNVKYTPEEIEERVRRNGAKLDDPNNIEREILLLQERIDWAKSLNAKLTKVNALTDGPRKDPIVKLSVKKDRKTESKEEPQEE